MSDIELKPCPFCGHQPKLWGEDGNIHGVQIECVNGRCPSEPHVWENTSAEAIAAWNRRAALPARGVGVKPLVWEAGERDQRRADSILGEFCVTFFGGRWFYQGEPRKGMLDAQAAAQADYEARILAALTPTDAAHVNETPKSEHDGADVLTDAAQAREAALREAAQACDYIFDTATESGVAVGAHECRTKIKSLMEAKS